MSHELINSTPEVGGSIPLKSKMELLERLKKIELGLFFFFFFGANIRRKEETELVVVIF